MTAKAQPGHGMDRPRLDYIGLFDASPNPQGCSTLLDGLY